MKSKLADRIYGVFEVVKKKLTSFAFCNYFVLLLKKKAINNFALDDRIELKVMYQKSKAMHLITKDNFACKFMNA